MEIQRDDGDALAAYERGKAIGKGTECDLDGPIDLHAARGLLERVANFDPTAPAVWIDGSCPVRAEHLRAIAHAAGVPPAKPDPERGGEFVYGGIAAIDLLGRLYEGARERGIPHDPWWVAGYGIALGHPDGEIPACSVTLTRRDAVVPSKANPSDVGYDLTLVDVAKRITDSVALYDTGVRIRPPYGYYAEIVPRSSLSKSGYVLANSIGIVDPGYSGNLLVALAKIDPSAAPVEFPYRCCQLVFRRQVHVRFEVSDLSGEDTARGEGGFGSSGGSVSM